MQILVMLIAKGAQYPELQSYHYEFYDMTRRSCYNRVVIAIILSIYIGKWLKYIYIYNNNYYFNIPNAF